MEEWKEYKLGEITDMKNGKKRPQKEGPYPVYGGNGIMDYSNDYNAERVVIVGRVGAYCGCVYQCDEKCWVSDNAIAVFPKDIVDFHFLHYLMSNLDFHHHHIGGAQPLMTQDIIGNFNIKLPSLKVQDQIVSVLKSLDDKIEVNRRINENLEQQAQALFKSWFVDFEPFRDKPFVESELGMIPEGWRVGTLGEIIESIESGSRPKGGAETNGFASIGAEKIERFGYYDYSNEKYVNADYYLKMRRGHVKDGDVLLYKDGAYTGKSSMALDGFPYKDCAVNEHVFLMRTKSSKKQFFLYCLMSYPDVKTMVYTLATAKAAQPGLNQRELLSIAIVIPDERIMQQFNDLIAAGMHKIAANALQNRVLSSLRDTLLPRLMSGELEVNDIEQSL